MEHILIIWCGETCELDVQTPILRVGHFPDVINIIVYFLHKSTAIDKY